MRLQWTQSQATWLSKERVKREAWCAQGTAALTAPWEGHFTRRVEYSDENHGRTEVERTPATRSYRAVVDGAPLFAVRAQAGSTLSRAAGNDKPTFFESDGFDDTTRDTEQHGKYSFE